MHRVLVTGATGSIGRALVEKLANEGIEVTAICRRNSLKRKNIPLLNGVEIVDCDLDQIYLLKDILQDSYDTCYHLAWCSTTGTDRYDTMLQIGNIKYTLNMVEIARQLGCSKFIGAGSQAEYGRTDQKLNSMTPTHPESAYGAAKLCAGQMSRIRCRQLGMDHIWTRILSVYGPGDNDSLVMYLLTKLLADEIPHCTKGEQMWDYIYSKDAAKALFLLGEKGISGHTYCIGSGQGMRLAEYIDLIKKSVGCEREVGIGDLPYSEDQVMHLEADISELVKDTGYQAEYSFAEGLRETIAWIKNNQLDR